MRTPLPMNPGAVTGGARRGVLRQAATLAGRPPVLAVLVTGVGVIIWLAVFPRAGTDLSAQIARAGWAARYPGAAYLFSWYGGIYPASYALLTPYVLALAGTRQAMAAAVLISAALLGAEFERQEIPRPRAAAVWGGIALWTQLSAGRAAFSLGIAAGLGCVAAAGDGRAGPRWRWPAVAVLAVLTTLFSPVAGLFLGVPAAAFLLTGRIRAGLVTGIAAGLPLITLAFFSDGGVQPIGPQNGVPALLAAAGVVVFVPRRWRMLRIGALAYAAGVALAWAIPTPVGSNAERLGELLVGPLLAGIGSLRYRWLLAGGLAAAAFWQVAQPVADLSQGNAPPVFPQTTALIAELRALRADTVRVEAVPQYGHWESQQLAMTVPLARGWERQLDTVRNPLFYGGILTPAAYHAWLRENAVGYVAISAATPDPAAAAEAQTVREGQPWLVPVWHDAYWQLYRVTGTLPLASRPAVVLRSTPAQVVLRMRRPGTAVVRVRWSPFLQVTGGRAAADRDGRWTSLTVRAAGVYVLSAPY
ncbi:MAG: MFS transporter [Streptosporangiaceae bacterium]